MKKKICVMLVLSMLICALPSGVCGKDVATSSEANKTKVATVSVAKEVLSNEVAPKIDVDLTKMSKTMVYSEVSNMMSRSESYIGKVVKMYGKFSCVSTKKKTNGAPDFNYPVYYACIINDALACCSQGIEFVPKKAFVYPDDYKAGNLTVVGTFDTYMENGKKYCHLLDAVVEK